MATDFNCSECRHARAEGQCPTCHQVLCQSCYNQHECRIPSEPEIPANLQCSACHTEPAAFLCLCKYPCPVFCGQCFTKHSGGLPMHFNLPMMYQNRFKSLEEFRMRKARYTNMQRLYTDITSSVQQIGEFRRAFEGKLNEMIDNMIALRDKMGADTVRAQEAMQDQETYLRNSFTEILMSMEERPSNELVKLVDANYPTSVTLESHIDFSPVQEALRKAASFHSPLLSQLRPQLPALSPTHILPATSSGSKMCNICGRSFSTPAAEDIEEMQKLSGIWADFCSLACLQQLYEG